MQWAGWIALILILCYSSYPGRVNRIEARIKRMERIQKGDSSMSKLLNSLIGKNCKIKFEGSFDMSEYTVLDVDDEWLKVSSKDKKNNVKTQIMRVESIENIELLVEKDKLSDIKE